MKTIRRQKPRRLLHTADARNWGREYDDNGLQYAEWDSIHFETGYNKYICNFCFQGTNITTWLVSRSLNPFANFPWMLLFKSLQALLPKSTCGLRLANLRITSKYLSFFSVNHIFFTFLICFPLEYRVYLIFEYACGMRAYRMKVTWVRRFARNRLP